MSQKNADETDGHETYDGGNGSRKLSVYETNLRELLLVRMRGKFVFDEEGRQSMEAMIEEKKISYGLTKSALPKD